MKHEFLFLLIAIVYLFLIALIALQHIRNESDRKNRQLRLDVWYLMRLLNFNSFYPTSKEQAEEIDRFWKGWKK